MLTLPFHVVLGMAITKLSIFSGVTLEVNDGHRKVQATLKPKFHRPIKGKIHSINTEWGECQGSYKVDFKEGSTKIDFYKEGKSGNGPDCQNNNMKILSPVTDEQFINFLDGDEVEVKIRWDNQKGELQKAKVKLVR